MSKQSGRILVVEDHLDMQRSIQRGLKENGYAVDLASDGEEAIYRIENWEYDGILLDGMLPKIDGFTVLKTIRQRGIETPVLLLTALADVSHIVKGLDLGADDYVVKPFDFLELLARLNSMLRRARNTTTHLIQLPGITINTQSQTLEANGEKIQFTTQEYTIVMALIHNRGKILTRQFLYDRINDAEGDVNSNLLDVLMYNIRKKVGKNTIKTLRGQGYIIEDV